MAYSDFTLSALKNQFQLTIEGETNLFPAAQDMAISAMLQAILAENIPLALAIHTEKARSEMIVTPVLIELRRLMQHQISLFSGVEFNVDKDQGLNGICDYIIGRSKEQLYVSAPIISIVEAKNDNIKSGLAQCAAAMVASRIFNEQQGTPLDAVYGIATTGSIWRFLKLADMLYIDNKEYYIEQVGKILAIMLSIVK